MWFDPASPYAFRSKLFSFAAPMNTLSNLFRYKLEKDHFGMCSKNQVNSSNSMIISKSKCDTVSLISKRSFELKHSIHF